MGPYTPVMGRLGALWVVGVCVLGCATSSSDGEPLSSERTVLGQLQTRDRALVMLSSDGEGEPRYAVTTLDGRVVSEAVDADTLEREHPDLADALRSGTARPYLDASLDGRSDVSPTVDASLGY